MTSNQRENKMRQSNLLSYMNKMTIKEGDSGQKAKQQPKGEPEPIVLPEKPLSKLRRLNESSDSDDEEVYVKKESEVKHPQTEVRKVAMAKSHPCKEPPVRTYPKNKTTGKASARGKSEGGKMEVESQSEAGDDLGGLRTPTEGGSVQFTDKTPDFAIKGSLFCFDKNGRNYTHEEYDPTTLSIEPKKLKDMTNTMKQFWQIKKQNFDKVVLFKLGKFYELFYDDAEIANKYLNLNYMGTKMHAGFPEKCLDRYTDELVQLGFKVVVVEQMETAEEMQERVKAEKNKGKTVEKCMAREITQVLTKGTYTKPTSLEEQEGDTTSKSYTPNYLVSVQCNQPLYAFALLDSANNRIVVGVSKSLDEFKTMLYRTRPVELLYDPANLPLDEKRMMTQSFLSMIQSPLANKESEWHHLNGQTILREGNKEFTELERYPDKLRQMMYGCLSGLFAYLKSLLQLDTVLATARLQIYEPEKMLRDSMLLDSQALQHLQLLETSTGEEKGSLLHLINKCRTGFGKRLLKRWLCSPSTSLDIINQRLDAAEDLRSYPTERNRLADGMARLGDLQLMISKLYRYSVKNLANKAVYFGDVSASRMKDYRKFFTNIEQSWNLLGVLQKNVGVFKSKRLRSLLSQCRQSQLQNVYMEEEFEQTDAPALLPDILTHLRQIDEFVKWDSEGNPLPQKGLFEEYDSTVTEISRIEEQLKEYLQNEREAMNQPKLKFTHTKQRYEIEVPNCAIKRKPEKYIFSSKKQGFERYATKEIRKLVQTLQSAEQRLKDHLRSYTTFFFEEFRKKSRIWEQYVRVLAELDCLISNSLVSEMWESCRPKFNNEGRLDIVQGRHPCLTHLIFVPNDIHIDSERSMMLLTGPNMGGKSTLLRMVCVLAVIAQMGIFVPCSSYDSIIFDRVFTRIGASDRLLEKKSTFYIEMEETKSILDHATPNSLVIVDELGRGTSTFDGMAIASAALKYLCDKSKCLGFFATHYYILVEEFLFNRNVSINHMSYLVNGDTRQIKFMYRLKEGRCDESFAVNVARMVGIDNEIIDKAEELAQTMRKQIRRKRMIQINESLEQIRNEFSL